MNLSRATASDFLPRSLRFLGRSLYRYDSWLFTSTWNCVNSFVKGLRDSNIVGSAPLLRSAMRLAAKLSASSIAAVSLIMPSLRLELYRARTTVSEVNMSIHSIGFVRTFEASCVQLSTRGSEPMRLVRKSDLVLKPSSLTIALSVSRMLVRMSPALTSAQA